MSFITRHRTICAVIQQIRMEAERRNDEHTMQLCDEARTYAESMSAALVKYKEVVASLK